MAVLLLAVPLRPDALVITKAMMATIAETFVDHVVILVHRAPRILALTLDGDEDLIQCHVSPRRPCRRFSPREYSGPNSRHHFRIMSYETVIPR